MFRSLARLSKVAARPAMRAAPMVAVPRRAMSDKADFNVKYVPHPCSPLPAPSWHCPQQCCASLILVQFISHCILLSRCRNTPAVPGSAPAEPFAEMACFSKAPLLFCHNASLRSRRPLVLSSLTARHALPTPCLVAPPRSFSSQHPDPLRPHRRARGYRRRHEPCH